MAKKRGKGAYMLSRFAGVSDPAQRESGSPQAKSRAKRGNF